LRQHLLQLAIALCLAAALAGCAGVNLEQSLNRVNAEAASFTGGELALARSAAERDRREQAVRELLREPLGQVAAVRLALLNSPALQALLAQSWADAAEAAQLGRPINPLFSFERLAGSGELEIARTLSVGLLDLITLPVRQGVAAQRVELTQLRLTAEVVDHLTRVRQAWVRAVAAQQQVAHAQQVFEGAEAAAELARRMRAVGNFNRLDHAREQAFYADATTRLALAKHRRSAAREELVRAIGLDQAQAQQLVLPERLPDLPPQALDPQAAGVLATKARLDIRLAQTALDAAAKVQGLNTVTSFTDIELSARRDSRSDAAGGGASLHGYEVGLRLPIFDWGGMQRDAWNARTLAAANGLEASVRAAGSNLRESYSAYRTAFDLARHYRDNVLPLRRVIADENQLRYNAMLIGVFELLADARDQVTTVMAAIDAETQFWLADAALQASLIGRPTGNTPLFAAPGLSAAAASH
jgi:outer membrane protein TolC